MTDTYSRVPRRNVAHMEFYRAIFTYKPASGNGYLSSTLPNFIVSVSGVPAVGEVRVLLRSSPVPQGDGILVAKTTSNVSGQWRIDGLNPKYTYDVVCRVDGYNDLIFSNVKPRV